MTFTLTKHRTPVTPVAPLGQLLTGTPGPDTLAALGEGDVLRGLGGADRLSSGFSDVVLHGDAGDDELATEISQASAEGQDASVVAEQYGGTGHDLLTMTLAAEGGDEFHSPIQFGFAAYGGSGNDSIAIDAGIGMYVAVEAFEGEVLGGAGNDTIAVTLEHAGYARLAPLVVAGEAGNDTITVANRVDSDMNFSDAGAWNQVSGGAGRDVITAEASGGGDGSVGHRNDLRGGAGNDQLTAIAIAGTNMAGIFLTNNVWGHGGDDLIRSELLVGSGFAAARARLYGGVGDDEITAVLDPAGDDSEIYNLDSEARLSGGGGDDRLVVEIGADEAVIEEPERIVNRLAGDDGADDLRATIDPRWTEFDAGFEARSLLLGGTGDDRLAVQGGRDNVLDGGSGADVMIGGTGDDTFHVDDLGDVAFEDAELSGGVDSVIALVSHRLGRGIENLTLAGAAERGYGQGEDNVILGSVMGNLLRGAGGNDRIEGGRGDDRLYGDAGADLLDGGTGHDRLWGGTGADRLLGGAGNDELWGGGGNDVLDGGTGYNLLRGGAGADVLSGSGRLFGEAGDDRLVARAGADAVLSGGAGTDTYVIARGSDEEPSSVGFGFSDFDAAVDRLEFVGFVEAAEDPVAALDEIASFSMNWGRLTIAMPGTTLWFDYAPSGTDSFAELVADPARQILLGEDLLA